ncbi:cytochrome C oxidase subunit IV family protein [Haloferax sp. AB510]|uniref:cytochrome C oxidase subunit IV family protein n=1 Tax=Haloferax sp. AB510 TaxID=2934172 RepID=UPI00209C0CAF|nr:cytochrome C oxidase subunit IV family protein [Haloferax sp. AB510]MCO8268379.1 cytochrome C oxidase subunit IV family protein [Haloferax sp. AB510]
MVSTKLYTAIYVVLFVSATVQVLVEFAGLSYWLAFGVIMVLSVAKAVLVAAYFQHLRFEPRSLTYLVGIGLAAALALTLAASYSLL